MKNIYLITILLIITGSIFAKTETIKRYALVVGCNYGGENTEDLRYSVEDAKNFKDVITSLGGTENENVILLDNPDTEVLKSSIMNLKSRLISDSNSSYRTEVIFFYSGHSDKKGLKLYDNNFSYKELKEDIDSLKSDVKIVVLDSCYSGEFTRYKGGVRKSPFIFDVSNDTEGRAVLTSSTKDERSQESDIYGSSFFSHALITGLRGAADSNKDSKVTLNEAYQYAFDETLKKTESDGQITQHPAYNIDLKGTGNLVLTDLEALSSKIVLKKDLYGTVTIRDKNDNLIAEIDKYSGDEIEFCIDSGKYQIKLTKESKSYYGTFNLRENDIITSDDFSLQKKRSIISIFKGDRDNKSFYPVGYNYRGEDGRALWGLSIVGSEFNEFSAFNMGLVYSRSSGNSSWYQGALGANFSKDNFSGFQLSALLNYSYGNVSGVQLSGININKSIKGLQLGLLNRSNDFTGIQLGLINRTKKGKGLQIGLVNISDELTGIPLGLIDIQKNGENYFTTWLEAGMDNRYIYSGYRFGSKYMYKQLSIGSGKVGSRDFLKGSIGIDFGVRLPLLNNKASLLNDIGVEYISKIDSDDYENYNSVIPKMSSRAEFKISKGFGIIAGVSTRFYFNSFNDNMKDGSAYKSSNPFGSCHLSHRFIVGIEFN